MARDPETLRRWREYSALRYRRHRETLIARRIENMKRRGDYISQKKLERGACADCGIEVEDWNTAVFAFDHRHPETKSFSPSHGRGRSEATIDEELAKCDLVCHNCHAIRTHVLRDHADWIRQRRGIEPVIDIRYRGLQLKLFEDDNG